MFAHVSCVYSQIPGKMSEGKEEKKSSSGSTENIVGEELVFSKHEKFGLTYNRSSSTAVEELKVELCKLYAVKSVHRCFIVPSGMAAISTTISAIKHLAETTPIAIGRNATGVLGMNLFYGDQLFSVTPKLFQSLATSSPSTKIYPIPLMSDFVDSDFKLPVAEEELAWAVL